MPMFICSLSFHSSILPSFFLLFIHSLFFLSFCPSIHLFILLILRSLFSSSFLLPSSFFPTLFSSSHPFYLSSFTLFFLSFFLLPFIHSFTFFFLPSFICSVSFLLSFLLSLILHSFLPPILPFCLPSFVHSFLLLIHPSILPSFCSFVHFPSSHPSFLICLFFPSSCHSFSPQFVNLFLCCFVSLNLIPLLFLILCSNGNICVWSVGGAGLFMAQWQGHQLSTTHPDLQESSTHSKLLPMTFYCRRDTPHHCLKQTHIHTQTEIHRHAHTAQALCSDSPYINCKAMFRIAFMARGDAGLSG